MMASLALPRSLDPYSNRYYSGEFDEFSRLNQNFTRKPRFNHYLTIDEQEEEEEKPEQQHEPEEKFEEEEENEPIVDEEFSFPLPILEESPISADEAFQNGQIRPILYPIFDQSLLHRSPISTDESFQIRPVHSIFNRSLHYTEAEGGDSNNSAPSPRSPLKKLFVEQRDPISSPEALGSAAGPYCEWSGKVSSSSSASPEICRKSNSTGFSKIWKLRDMVVHRSNSDGNDAFVFLNNTNKRSGSRKVVVKKEAKNKTTPSAHELHYVKNRAMREEVKRRSYLPYRQGVVGVGFFTSVNGLTRNLHPY